MKKTVSKNKPTTKPTKTRKITKDDNLAEVLFKYPQIAEILMDYGLHCVGCAANIYDSIEDGAKIHGMTAKEIKEIVDRVNEVIEHGE